MNNLLGLHQTGPGEDEKYSKKQQASGSGLGRPPDPPDISMINREERNPNFPIHGSQEGTSDKSKMEEACSSGQGDAVAMEAVDVGGSGTEAVPETQF